MSYALYGALLLRRYTAALKTCRIRRIGGARDMCWLPCIDHREETMAKDIYWLCVFKLKPGDFEAFKAVVRPLVEMTKKEQGSIAYEYCTSKDHTEVHIIEHYRDSNSVVHHVQNTFAQFAEKFTALATVSSFVVYGEPEPEAKNILDGFGAIYVDRFDGFTK
jgi:quinol monooxygenase YgiN